VDQPDDTLHIICAFSMTPIGSSESVSGPVAEVVRLVRESGLPNETNAMFTNVEGPWDDVMNLIRLCCQEMERVAPRVSVVMKVDCRKGVRDGLRSKVLSVEERLVEHA
jgi:uncharacterized protein (TIGR00106 family)